jgi:hypothetical protein
MESQTFAAEMRHRRLSCILDAEMLPPFGDITRNNSMTNNSSGEKGAPLALSKFPLIVF